MDDLYVASRLVLLDALDALVSHRHALTLVGAQAVYLRVGDATLAVAPYTTDGDLMINPAQLGQTPALEDALQDAGFRPKDANSVGIWVTHVAMAGNPSTEIAIDLLVPRGPEAEPRRRGAQLAGHNERAARMVTGLEGAVVDSDVMELGSLDVADTRAITIQVAGPAALLVAKVHKVCEREGTSRQRDKDALDVYRLLRGTSTADLAGRYGQLLEDVRSRAVSKEAISLLRDAFARRQGIGVAMLRRAVEGVEDPTETAAACEVLTEDLLTMLEG